MIWRKCTPLHLSRSPYSAPDHRTGYAPSGARTAVGGPQTRALWLSARPPGVTPVCGQTAAKRDRRLRVLCSRPCVASRDGLPDGPPGRSACSRRHQRPAGAPDGTAPVAAAGAPGAAHGGAAGRRLGPHALARCDPRRHLPGNAWEHGLGGAGAARGPRRGRGMDAGHARGTRDRSPTGGALRPPPGGRRASAGRGAAGLCGCPR